jgi:sialate O-acetylesterase
MKNVLIMALAMFSISVRAGDEAKFASVLTDNMVLQQMSSVNLWGTAKSKETLCIKCSWSESDKFVKADQSGFWTIQIKTPKGSFEPHNISLTDSKGKVTILKNILIGEVWLCSGQSNMEMTLMSQPDWNLIVENSEKEILNSTNPYLRLINIGRKESFSPIEDAITNGWKESTPENSKWFSAVAYFFGRRLFNELNVPVGLIVSSYGGSPIQSWIPYYILNENEVYKEEVSLRNEEVKASQQSEEEYVKNMSEWIVVSENNSLRKAVNDSIVLDLPVNLEKSPVGNQLGEVVFKKIIEVPVSDIGKDIHFSLGTIDDLGRIYFNGELVWSEIRNSKSYSQVAFTVPAEKIKSGLSNVIEARVLNTLWGGGLTGPAENMFFTSGDGGEKISLSGSWHYNKIFDLADVDPIPMEGKPLFSTAGTLYNGMINPLLRYTVRGFLWYQGEGNISEADKYTRMFSDLVHSWRKEFGKELPFYFVQIAPYKYGSYNGQEAAELREAQSNAVKTIPNTEMIVTMDIGDPLNIHPAKKREVGERLAIKALSETYNVKISSAYPKEKYAKVFADTVTIYFTNVYKGLISKSDCPDFEVSEDGEKYFAAEAEIRGDRINVYSQQFIRPKYVRYCWRDDATGTIFNSENLPLSSFRLKVSD